MTTWLLAFVVGLITPVFVAIALIREPQAITSVSGLILILVVCSAPFTATTVLIHNTSKYVADKDYFARVSPFWFGSWKIFAYDVSTVELLVGNHDPVLVLKPLSGKNRRFVLPPDGCHQLQSLYPSLHCSDEPVTLPDWLRWVFYPILFFVIVAAAGIMFWMWQNGLSI